MQLPFGQFNFPHTPHHLRPRAPSKLLPHKLPQPLLPLFKPNPFPVIDQLSNLLENREPHLRRKQPIDAKKKIGDKTVTLLEHVDVHFGHGLRNKLEIVFPNSVDESAGFEERFDGELAFEAFAAEVVAVEAVLDFAVFVEGGVLG